MPEEISKEEYQAAIDVLKAKIAPALINYGEDSVQMRSLRNAISEAELHSGGPGLFRNKAYESLKSEVEHE